MGIRKEQRSERLGEGRGSCLDSGSRRLVFACLALALALLAGCAHCPLCGGLWDRPAPPVPVKPADMRTAAGTVACLERVAILPTFELKVMLVALDPCGSGAREVLAEQVLKPLAALPASFAFDYDHARLLPTRSYGLEAELWSQGARLFRTDTQYRVSPDGPAAKADLVLVREP